MRRHADPTNERADRIAEIRTRLYEIHAIRRERPLTAAEEYEYQRLNDELREARGGE